MVLHNILVIGVHLLLSSTLCWTQSTTVTHTNDTTLPVTTTTNSMLPFPTATNNMPRVTATTNNMPPTSKAPLECIHCSVAAELLQDCKYSVTCQPDEVCYAQIADIPSFDGVSPGRKHYYSGCVAARRCPNVNDAILSPDGTLERGIPLCGGCCATSGCSRHLCGLDTPLPLKCSHCSTAAEHKENCDEVVSCQTDEVCYAQVADIPSHDGVSPGRHHYYSGCLAKDRCSNVNTAVLKPDGTLERGIPLCGGCCNGTVCNKHICGLDIPDPAQCRQCSTGSENKGDCDGTITCQQGEVCYAQTTSAGQSKTHYYSGCVTEDRCSQVTNTVLLPDGTVESGVPICGGCCNGTNCNEHLCGLDIPVISVTTEKAVTDKAALTCGLCTKPGFIGNCDGVTTCSDGEVCYSQVTEIVHFSLFGEPEKHFYSGCIQADKCTNVGSTLLEPDGTLESQTPLCGGCCNKDECNKYLCDIHKKGVP